MIWLYLEINQNFHFLCLLIEIARIELIIISQQMRVALFIYHGIYLYTVIYPAIVYYTYSCCSVIEDSAYTCKNILQTSDFNNISTYFNLAIRI